ncbi:MAG: UDP-N-acetylmuramate:L-alanyl-gamma-D-glutamyl-meso-diaminopimelate ligase [Parcubacteria group bacterium GW2011_GWB1_36_5]|nr:MAG: UDP-N-acetylmuramate:L-alanyl-gamma-D-glutamyl-meso-diaminopimelate ligase [Parcubacteria group bacterium GW2011_GWB1_36_5]
MIKKTNTSKKVHLIGICGAGMSALAVLLKESGWQVTGTDEGFFEPIPSYLKKNEILFYKKYNKKNVPQDADLIVIGNNIPLSIEENSEKKCAVKLGLKMQSLPETLAMLSKNTENIVVAGSAGKSTVTGLLSWCLFEGKKDPSYFIGALPLDLKNSSHLGKGKEFVLEGDEYTSSKNDPRSKFLHLNPTSVLLTSIQHDHVNIFPTEKSYKEPYKKLMQKIPKKGLLVYSLDGKNNKEISKYAQSKIVSYSLNQKTANWYAQNVKYGIQSSFDLMHEGKKVITVKTKLLGKHNIENIIGAGAFLLEKKKITPKVFAEAINSFHGIKSRIELKTKKSIIPVYEGFGSSYEKAKTIFDALRLHFRGHRIIAVFEPHAFSWRNKKFLKWYQTIFNNVDEVVMLPATSHGKKAKNQLTSTEVWKEAKKYAKIHTALGEKEALQILSKITKENDVVALVSSGSLFGLNNSVPKLMEKKFPSAIDLRARPK